MNQRVREIAKLTCVARNMDNPVISVTWVAANHARYKGLLPHDATCPICCRGYPAMSPEFYPLTEGAHRCIHWMCEDCLLRLRKDECPFCKDNITGFIQKHKVKYAGGGIDDATVRSYVTESAILLSLLLPVMDEAWEGKTWVADMSTLMPMYSRVAGLIAQAVELTSNLRAHSTINAPFRPRTSGYAVESTLEREDEFRDYLTVGG